MEEKVFELLSQMHNEIKDMKANMATKEDLLGMATKEDLRGMASKSDIVNIDTKEDLKRMATKDDIRRLETELIRIGDKFDCKFDALIEGYKQNTKAIQEISKDVRSLKSVVEQHEIKLKIVK
ncbi:MAG: hypothetical protein ACYCYE_13385 [Clostridia bacterium]